MVSCFSGNLVAEGDAWRRDLLAFCVLLCAVPWAAKTLIRKGARLTGRGCRKGRVEGVCVARRTGLASLQLSCQLDPRSACHPRPPGQSLPSGRGLYSNHSHLWIKETSPCPHGQVGQGVSGTLLPFCTGQQFCRKGVEAVSGPTPASCSFLHRLCLLYLPKLLFAPQPLWLPVPVGTWHGVRRPTMPK